MTAEEELRMAEIIERRKRVAEFLSSMANMPDEEMADLHFEHAGFVDGEHFTAYVEEVKRLKREKRHEEAIALLLKLIYATEAESRDPGGADRVAPWYYEQLAIIYRKERRFADEVAILERYEDQCNQLGRSAGRLAERLTKARAKNEKAAGTSKAIPNPGAGFLFEGVEEGTKTDKPSLAGVRNLAEFLEKAKSIFPELIDFRIDLSEGFFPKSRDKNQQPTRWIQPGETVKIGNFAIQRGFFYVGGHLKSPDPFELDHDPSLVDPTLDVDADATEYIGERPEYWYGYGSFTPQDRAEFLAWLASDRSDPETFIDYVLLYFCGIERRLLIDDMDGRVPDDERKALMQELSRLKSVYGGHRSFNNCVSRLLSYVWAINYGKFDEPPDDELLFAKSSFSSAFKVALAETAQSGEPVRAELALAWVRSHPDFTLRTPARRCPELYDTLFKMRYNQEFGAGLTLKPGRAKLRLEYYPANPALQYLIPAPYLDLPDVSRMKTPFKKLMILAGSCADELDSFSRFLGKTGNSPESLQALSLLPDDLVSLRPDSQLERFKVWVKTKLSDSGGTASAQSMADRNVGKERLDQHDIIHCESLVSVASLLSQLGEEAPTAINSKEAQMLSNVAEKAGHGIAPDIRFHHAKPDIDGTIVLFAGGHGQNFVPSSEFNKVVTMLRLGALAASADEHISDSEVSALNDAIAHNSRLTETEKRSLYAYTLWRLHSPPSKTGLKKGLDALSASEKVAISHVLVGVALADGKIDPAEIRQLEKLYTQLGLEKGMVARDIHSLASSRSPRSERKSGTSSATPIKAQDGSTSAFTLDHELLRRYEGETREAQSVLESILVDEDPLEESDNETSTAAPTGSGSIPGLDIQYRRLFDKLIAKEEWTHEEMKRLCDSLQLMTDGAVETINDWAFVHVGAPLIEEGSAVHIDIDIAEEIAALQSQGQ